MADNIDVTPGTGATVATDDCAAAGHTQIIKLAVAADGDATRLPATATDGLLVNLGANNDVTIASLPALAAGTNNIGDVDVLTLPSIPAGTNNIGDVDVLSVVPGTGATNLGKAEDAAHADGDTGVLILGVRNHGGAGADGDYSAFSVNSTGEQRVVAHRETTRIAVDSGGLTTSVTAYTAGDQVGTQFSLTGAARNSGGSGTIVAVQLISAADIIGAYDVVFTRSSITLAADNAAFAISDTDAKAVIGLVQLAGAFDIGNNRIAQAYNLAVPYDCSGGTTLYASLITRVGHTFFAAATDLQLCVWVERN